MGLSIKGICQNLRFLKFSRICLRDMSTCHIQKAITLLIPVGSCSNFHCSVPNNQENSLMWCDKRSTKSLEYYGGTPVFFLVALFEDNRGTTGESERLTARIHLSALVKHPLRLFQVCLF